MAEYEIEFKCKHCGKQITVLHPSQWGYKVRNKKGGWNYFCTWKCLRADERKEPMPEKAEEPEEKEGRNNRLEVLEELLEAVKGGKDAYDFLEQMGYTDPKDTLRRLRITAKKEAPKLYTKMEKAGLMDMRKGRSGKGADNVNKLTREQKEKAVNIALEGGDYLDHLKKCGSKNPSAAWWYIKKTLAKSNPTLLAQVMKKTGEIEEIKAPENTEGGPVVEKADKLPPEADVPPQEPEVNYLEKVKAEDVVTKEQEMKLDGFRVTAVNGKFGQYRVGIDPSRKEAYFDFDGPDYDPQLRTQQNDMAAFIRIPQHDLAAFVEELTRAAQILGVDAG